MAKQYPSIEYTELGMHNTILQVGGRRGKRGNTGTDTNSTCTYTQMTSNPDTFDTLLTPNLYGDIAADLAAGLVGFQELFYEKLPQTNSK